LALGLSFCLLARYYDGLGRDKSDKDLEIVALRQQVRILERKLGSKPRISRAEKVFLAALADKLRNSGKGGKARLGSSILMFRPDTVLKGNW